jgi:hypothetical protein
MKITHTLTFPKEPRVEQCLSEIGITSRDSMILNIVISEDDPLWPDVAPLIRKYSAVDIVITTFTKSEIQAAKHLILRPSWHHGYPMPDDDFGYIETTYNSNSLCQTCGGGKTQQTPFRMRGEPKWGRRSILQLNWVFDEYFVKPDIHESVFRPCGIEAREVLHHKTLSRLDTVVQLIVPSVSVPRLQLDDHPYSDCLRCGRTRHIPYTRGPWPVFQGKPPSDHMFWTNEVFGSGACSHREVVVSHELCALMLEHSVRGVDFGVIKNSETSNK